MGRGNGNHFVGADVPEIFTESRRGHRGHTRDRQAGPPVRQPQGGTWTVADGGATEGTDRAGWLKTGGASAADREFFAGETRPLSSNASDTTARARSGARRAGT